MPQTSTTSKTPMLTLVNGMPELTISVADRGLLYGDGFFTTLHVKQGEPQLWKLHQKRLSQCARVLLGWEVFPAELLATLHEEIRIVAQLHESCGVRITLTRGVGGRGYAPAVCKEARDQQLTRVVSSFAYPEHYAKWQQEGIQAEVAQFYLADCHPALVGLKTLNRIEQVMIKQELALYQTDDVIVLDAKGKVAEASAGNLFWRKNKTWFTPRLASCGVHGVVRAALLQKYLKVKCVEAPIEELMNADEAFVCNALMGQVSLKQVAGYSFPVVRSYAGQSTFVLLDG